MEYVNLTPHQINLNNGRNFPASGQVARITVGFSEIKGDLCCQFFGEVKNLPSYQEGVRYIVSVMILSALRGSRPDVVAPATGHPECVRNEAGHIVSVPCFVQ